MRGGSFNSYSGCEENHWEDIHDLSGISEAKNNVSSKTFSSKEPHEHKKQSQKVLSSNKAVNMGDMKRRNVKYFVNEYSHLSKGAIFEIKRVNKKPIKSKPSNKSNKKKSRKSESAASTPNPTNTKPGDSSKVEYQKKAFKITKKSDKKEKGSRNDESDQDSCYEKSHKESKNKLSHDHVVSPYSSPVDITADTTITEKNNWEKESNSKAGYVSSFKKEKSKKVNKDQYKDFLFRESRKKRGPKKVKRQQGEGPVIHFSLSGDKI